MHHPYIVTLRYSFQTPTKLYLILDFINGGHLFFQLYHQGTFDESLARLYTAELVLAITHLHSLGIVHRDLKVGPAAMRGSSRTWEQRQWLFRVSRSGQSLLCPFSPAAREHPPGPRGAHPPDRLWPCEERQAGREGQLVHRHHGKCRRQLLQPARLLPCTCPPPRLLPARLPARLLRARLLFQEYMAPEIIAGKGHGKEVDWWSVGILLFEMVNGMPPFRSGNKQTLQKKITTEKIKYPTYLSPDCLALLKGLLNREPAKRLGAGTDGSRDVMSHVFFKKIDWKKLEARLIPSPFKPTLASSSSVENFDKVWTDMPPVESPCGTPGDGAPILSKNLDHELFRASSCCLAGSMRVPMATCPLLSVLAGLHVCRAKPAGQEGRRG